jgi:hypothetical protein
MALPMAGMLKSMGVDVEGLTKQAADIGATFTALSEGQANIDTSCQAIAETQGDLQAGQRELAQLFAMCMEAIGALHCKIDAISHRMEIDVPMTPEIEAMINTQSAEHLALLQTIAEKNAHVAAPTLPADTHLSHMPAGFNRPDDAPVAPPDARVWYKPAEYNRPDTVPFRTSAHRFDVA